MNPHFIEILLLGALVIVGIFRITTYTKLITKDVHSNGEVKVVTGERIENKQILWFIKYYGTKWLGERVMKPVCGCIPCMASIHGTWVYLYGISSPLDHPLLYIIYLLSLTGLLHVAISNSIIKHWLV